MLSRIRQHVDSERKLEYFPPDILKQVFKEYIFEPFLRGFQSVSTF